MSLLSSIIGSSQISKAVNAQVNAGNQAIGTVASSTNNANNTLAGVNSAEQQNLNPYLQLGQTGAANLNTALAPGGSLTSQFSFDPTQIASNPDYQFQLQQGTQAVQRAAAANGTVASGGTLKALDQFSQGLASNEISQAYNQAFNTYQANRTNNVQALELPLQTGLQGTSLSQNAYQNYGNQVAGNTVKAGQETAGLQTGIGAVQAGGSIAQGNLWSGFVNSATTAPAVNGGTVAQLGSMIGI